MNTLLLLPGIAIFLLVTAAHAADTLWLTSGEVIVCSDLTSKTNDIHERVALGNVTMSEDNPTTCGSETFGIDRVFAKRDKEGYFLKYRTGFVKRTATGRISFFEGTVVDLQKDMDSYRFNTAPKKNRVKFYSIDNDPPHRLRGRTDKALQEALASYEPSRTMLLRGKRLYLTGSIIGGIGAGILGLSFINVYPKNVQLPALGGSIAVVVAGGSLLFAGEMSKKRSIDLFNAGSP